MGLAILGAMTASHLRLEHRIERLEVRINNLAERLAHVETALAALAARVIRLEGEFANMPQWTRNMLGAVLRRPAA